MAITAFDTGIRALEIDYEYPWLQCRPSSLRGKIKHVDEHETQGDKENNPCRDNVLHKNNIGYVTLANDDDCLPEAQRKRPSSS